MLDRRSVVALPASAVRIDRADPYVLALEGGRVQARTVRTGLRGQDEGGEIVQIVDGLAEGAQVLGGSVGAIADGTAWRAAASAGGAPAPAASGAGAKGSAASGAGATASVPAGSGR